MNIPQLEESAQVMRIGDSEVPYKLVRSKKRKYSLSMKLNMRGDLQINVPHSTKKKAIEDFIFSKYSWIKNNKSAKLPQAKLPTQTYHDGEIHLYMGQQYRLKLITAKQSEVEINQEHICIYHRKNANIKNILSLWYKNKAYEHFQKRTQELAQTHHFPKIKAIKVRYMKARWGSCSSRKVITYNVHLIKATLESIDYVIVHELCHLLHHNHGTHFYQLQSQLNPGWNKQKQFLNIDGYKFIA